MGPGVVIIRFHEFFGSAEDRGFITGISTSGFNLGTHGCIGEVPTVPCYQIFDPICHSNGNMGGILRRIFRNPCRQITNYRGFDVNLWFHGQFVLVSGQGKPAKTGKTQPSKTCNSVAAPWKESCGDQRGMVLPARDRGRFLHRGPRPPQEIGSAAACRHATALNVRQDFGKCHLSTLENSQSQAESKSPFPWPLTSGPYSPPDFTVGVKLSFCCLGLSYSSESFCSSASLSARQSLVGQRIARWSSLPVSR